METAKMKTVSLEEGLKPANPKGNMKNVRKVKAMHALRGYAQSMEEERKYALAQTSDGSVVRDNVQNRVVTLGSEEDIYCFGDCGLFIAALTAYNNHWKFRTSPDDWWFCVTRKVAIAIDKKSKTQCVRDMFVSHEGKKTIQVTVPSNNIYDVNYTQFFDNIAKQIKVNVKTPEYVDAITADFSLTTPVQKIVSQITLMSSVQEFFEFKMMMLCGIPSVEMLGTEDDWAKLLSKLKVLRTLLEPIEKVLGLPSLWWATVKEVFENLLATYQGVPDKEWWSCIITRKSMGSGPSGYSGWLTYLIEGTREAVDIGDFSGGVVTVPLTIADPSGTEDTAALVAGMLGFTLHEDSLDQVPSVQPFQGWTLLLNENSPFRSQNI